MTGGRRETYTKPFIVAVNPNVEPFVSLAVLLERHCMLVATFGLPQALLLLRKHAPAMLIITLDREQLEGRYLLEVAREIDSVSSVLLILPPTEPPSLSPLARLPVKALYRAPVEVSQALDGVRKGLGLTLPPYDRRVNSAIDYMSKHRTAPLTVDRIAKAAGVSASRLAHLFHDELQVSVHGYLVRTRVEAAKYLLRITSKSLPEIASAVGFCDAGHLSRVFIGHVGYRPNEYRSRVLLPEFESPDDNGTGNLG